MKSLIFFAAVVIATGQGQELILPRHGLPPADPPKERAATPIWRNIVQPQDSFNYSNTVKWNMRYLENGEFFRTGGPIFIMLGGEWTIDEGWLQSGQMYEMAQIHGAYMFYTEHRYFGQSFPTSDLSTASVKFATCTQALRDVVRFIAAKKLIPTLANSKVVVFGGSYAGTMATWMRQYFPNWVHAAVSASAPLVAKVDFHGYQSVIQRDLGSSCASVVTRGVEEVLRLLSLGNVDKVQQDFNLCKPIDTNNNYDMEYFFVTIATQFGNVIQHADAQTIPSLCNTLQDPSLPSDYDRLANYMKDPKNCKGNYNYFLNTVTNTTLGSGDYRQWLYQMCTEFGWFQTSWASSALYSRTVPIDYYNRLCSVLFGPEFTADVTARGVEYTNREHGGLNPNVTRVVSDHATVDPWFALGLSQSPNPEAPVIVVPGSRHCAGLYGLLPSDSAAMREAKLAVRAHVAKWLQEE